MLSQQYQLSVMDLTVQTSADGSATEAVSLQHLASWIHPGLITALQVWDKTSSWRNLHISICSSPVPMTLAMPGHCRTARIPTLSNPSRLPLRQVVDFRRGEVVIFTGTAEGAVCRLRLQVPVSPGAAVADIKVLHWANATCHRSPAARQLCLSAAPDLLWYERPAVMRKTS